MTNALTHDAYMVIFRSRDGDLWCNETHFPGEDRAKFVSDVFGGEYDTGTIERIVRMNIAAGVVQDVTAEIAKAVCDLSWDKQDEPCDEAKDLCERFRFECFDEEAAAREDRAYRRQVEGDYRAMVGI